MPKILFYDFNKGNNEQLEALGMSISADLGYEIEVFNPKNPQDLASKLLEAVNDADCKIIANFYGGNGEFFEVVSRVRNSLQEGSAVLPEREDMKFLVFSDSDKVGRFFSYQGLGQAFSVGSAKMF